MSDQSAGRHPASADEGPRRRLDVVTDEVLPALIAKLRASRLGELEMASDGWRVRLRRDPDATRRRASMAAAIPDTGEPAVDVVDSVARSPSVGYFTPAPDLVLGHSVQAGDLLGAVDVLGIVHDVSAPCDGIVSRVLAETGQAVEYGQVLAQIEPLGPSFDEQPDEGPSGAAAVGD